MEEDLWEKKKAVIKRLSGICEMAEVWPEDLPQEFVAILVEGKRTECRPAAETLRPNQP